MSKRKIKQEQRVKKIIGGVVTQDLVSLVWNYYVEFQGKIVAHLNPGIKVFKCFVIKDEVCFTSLKHLASNEILCVNYISGRKCIFNFPIQTNVYTPLALVVGEEWVDIEDRKKDFTRVSSFSSKGVLVSQRHSGECDPSFGTVNRDLLSVADIQVTESFIIYWRTSFIDIASTSQLTIIFQDRLSGIKLNEIYFLYSTTRDCRLYTCEYDRNLLVMLVMTHVQEPLSCKLYRFPISNGKGTRLNAEDYYLLDVKTRLLPIKMCRVHNCLLLETIPSNIIKIDLSNATYKVLGWKLWNIHADGQYLVGKLNKEFVVLK